MKAFERRGFAPSAILAALAFGNILWYAWPELWRLWSEHRVQLRVAYDLEACPPERPLRLSVINQGQRRVRMVGWRLVVNPDQGDSRPFESSAYSTLPFIKSGYLGQHDSRSLCLPAPVLQGAHDPVSLDYGIEHKRVWFVE